MSVNNLHIIAIKDVQDKVYMNQHNIHPHPPQKITTIVFFLTLCPTSPNQ